MDLVYWSDAQFCLTKVLSIWRIFHFWFEHIRVLK